MFKAYNNLPPKTKAVVGGAILVWGAAGLYLSDRAEEHFGYTPTEEDKAKLRQYTPKLVHVEKKDQ